MSSGEASHTETIAGSPQECFDAITDYDTFPEWQKPVVACEVLERDKQGRGAVVKTTLDVKVRKISYTLHYHYEEPARIWWDYVEGDAKDIGGGYVFTDNGDGTTDAAYTVSIDFPMWIPGQIRRFLETQAITGSVRELKDRVEGR